MKNSKLVLRDKLNNGEKIYGTLVSLSDPCLCEIMGNVGYDCVWIDTEHTHMSYKEVLCHLNAARGADIPAVVRLPQNDLTATKKILEMDPDGVIFPMVRSAEEAEELIKMTLYPPLGTRGFGPLRAIGYGAMEAKEYVDVRSMDICRFLQIEHIDAINDIERIAALPYVDGFIFGPNDLSASIGEFLNVFGENTFSKIEYANKVIKKHGKWSGLACGSSSEEIERWWVLGFDLFFAGADWGFVFQHAKDTLKRMKETDSKLNSK